MMGPGFADGIAQAFAILVVVIIVAAFVCGLIVMWGAPHLWAWLRPILAGWLA